MIAGRALMTSFKRRTALMPRSKMGNVPVEVDGRRFASKKEAKRYGELVLLEKAGKIFDLRCQVRHKLQVNELLICTYVSDFTYTDEDSISHVEDVKGRRTGSAYGLFRIKAKLMLACLGVIVEEV